MNEHKISRSFGTHDGTFHADEVTACALLVFFDCIDIDKVIRTRNIDLLSSCEYVCDVGGIYDPALKRFDHHQAEYQGALSSAGMVLLYLKEIHKITPEEYKFFNDAIILGVDAHDNGKELQSVGVCTYSHIISNFSPIVHEVGKAALDQTFFQAVNFSQSLLKQMYKRRQYTQSCKKFVAEAMRNRTEYLIFDHNIPWQESFFALDGVKHPALFVIMPSDQHWKLRGIPPSLEQKMQVRLPLPKAWAGLLEEDLKKASGIPGAIFCHKGRFISVWETRDDALKALELVLSSTRSKK